MSDNIRRILCRACWLLALVLFVAGFGASLISWGGSFTLKSGLVTWNALAILMFVLIGRWVGPVNSAQRLPVEELSKIVTGMKAIQEGQSGLREEMASLRRDLDHRDEVRGRRASDLERRCDAVERKLDTLQDAVRAASAAHGHGRRQRGRASAKRPGKQRQHPEAERAAPDGGKTEVAERFSTYMTAREDILREQGERG